MCEIANQIIINPAPDKVKQDCIKVIENGDRLAFSPAGRLDPGFVHYGNLTSLP
jgi:hypothetical protein